MISRLIKITVIILFASKFSFAQTIQKIEPSLVKDTLSVSFNVQNLFSQKAKETLLSGLSVTVNLNFRLSFIGESVSFFGENVIFRIKRDVWEGNFQVTEITKTAEKKHFFYSFEETKNFLSKAVKRKLCHFRVLPTKSEIHVAIKVGVNLLPEQETEKLREWIKNSISEKSIKEEENLGFSLASLLNFFFKQEKERDEYSTSWVFSKSFTKEELKIEKN
ncbi:hypothetical protein IT568_09955 [bacterium]|nr:hypothetical protein [bacterium]